MKKIGLFNGAFINFMTTASIVKNQVKHHTLEDDVKKYMVLDVRSVFIDRTVKSK